MSSTINASTASGGGVITSADASGILQLQTGGTTAVTIDASQNVGIGTGSPISKLDVRGASGVTSFTGTTRLGTTVGGSTSTNDYSGIDFIGANSSGPTARIGVLSAGSGSLLQFGTSNGYASGITNTAMTIDQNGNLLFNSGYGSAATAYGCRAWVNFNGTGTVAIRASGNVSSITDNGVGDYTVNFTTAMPDANYAWSYASQYLNSGAIGNENILPMMKNGANLVLAGSLRFYTGTYAINAWDSAIIALQIFR